MKNLTNRMTQFILHPVEPVRTFAANYFTNRHYQPEGLVDLILQAIDKFGPDNCTGLLVAARNFSWSTSQYDRVLELLKDCQGSDLTNYFDSARLQYEFLIMDAPPSFLVEHRRELLEDISFGAGRGPVLQAFYRLPDHDPETLYAEMVSCVRSPDILIDLSNFPYDYGKFLASQLANLDAEDVSGRVRKMVQQHIMQDEWLLIFGLEFMAHARDVNMAPYIPLLAPHQEGKTEAFVTAVSANGTCGVAEEIIKQGKKASNQYHRNACEALCHIKEECVLDYCLNIARKKKNIQTRTAALVALEKLPDNSSLSVLKKARQDENYEEGWLDFNVATALHEVILKGDLEGDSQAAETLRQHEEELRRISSTRNSTMRDFFKQYLPAQ